MNYKLSIVFALSIGAFTANAQKAQDKLGNDINRIEGTIQKLKEPLQRKVADLERRKTALERKRSTELDKIERIQRKYRNVSESIVGESGLVQNPKHNFSIAFKTHFVAPGIDKEYPHKFETFPANSKEELPQAIQNWLDGHVNTAEKNGKEGITWKLLPNTLQVFSQDKA